MHSKSYISFKIADCPDEQMLRDYQKGILSRDNIRIVESHLADCEMCSDFVEGFSLLSNEKELVNEAQLMVTKIYNKNSKKNRIWLYATAASLFLAIALSSLIFLLPSKNNYVADETFNPLKKKDQPDTGINQPVNLEWVKNETETEISSKSEDIKQKGKGSIIDSRNERAKATGDGEIVNSPILEEQEVIESENFKSNTQTNNVVVDNVTTIKEDDQSPGYNDKSGAGVAEEKKSEKNEGLVADESKSNKKNKSESKNRESKDVSSEAVFSGQTSTPNKSAELTITVAGGTSTLSQDDNIILLSDLDKANDFLNKEQIDSAVVYALRGVNSNNDNNKWKSKLCLAKAYILKGEKEKAVVILKEIRAKASYRISKDADAELEKLGN